MALQNKEDGGRRPLEAGENEGKPTANAYKGIAWTENWHFVRQPRSGVAKIGHFEKTGNSSSISGSAPGKVPLLEIEAGSLKTTAPDPAAPP